MRTLAAMRGSYVAALLDCCREKLPVLQRGGGDNAGDNLEMNDDTIGRDMNYIVTYGCPPSLGTPTKSTISLAYFDWLRKKADAYHGDVTLHDALSTWQGTDGKAETFSKISQPLKLKHADWVPKPGSLPSQQS